MSYNDRIQGSCVINGRYCNGEYRYGSHPNRGGWDECLYIYRTPFSDDKLEVTKAERVHGSTMLTVSLPMDDIPLKDIMKLPVEKRRARIYPTVEFS